MSHPRIKMIAPLEQQDLNGAIWPLRAVKPDDVEELGRLMISAYAGTIDYDGETEEQAIREIRSMMNGKYGDFLRSCSFAIDGEEGLRSACLMSIWEHAPLVLVVMTRAEDKHLGLGEFLLRYCMQVLRDHGYANLALFVTEGNTPAQRLYEKLGFKVVVNHS